MKIVYDDYGGAHSTQVAAALHLGVIPADRVPTAEELMALPLFDRTTKDDHGNLIFMGVDSDDHEVYVLGRGPSAVAVERAIVSGMALAGGDMPGIRFFDTLPCVNLWMRIGGFLSRSLGWTALGRPLVVHGTRKAFPLLVKLVERAKKEVAASGNSQLVLSSDGCDLGAVAGRYVKRGIVPGRSDGPLCEPPAGQS